MSATRLPRFTRGSWRHDENGITRRFLSDNGVPPFGRAGRPSEDKRINSMTLGKRTSVTAISQIPKTLINETSGKSGYQS